MLGGSLFSTALAGALPKGKRRLQDELDAVPLAAKMVALEGCQRGCMLNWNASQ